MIQGMHRPRFFLYLFQRKQRRYKKTRRENIKCVQVKNNKLNIVNTNRIKHTKKRQFTIQISSFSYSSFVYSLSSFHIQQLTLQGWHSHGMAWRGRRHCQQRQQQRWQQKRQQKKLYQLAKTPATAASINTDFAIEYRRWCIPHSTNSTLQNMSPA